MATTRIGLGKDHKMNRMKDEWLGVTYPAPKFLQVEWFWNLWAKVMCPHGYHLLDECQSLEDHTLYCDACDLDIPIALPEEDTQYFRKIRVNKEKENDFPAPKVTLVNRPHCGCVPPNPRVPGWCAECGKPIKEK